MKYKIYHLSAYAMQMKVMIICILIKQIRLLILWYSDEKLHRFSLMQVLFTSFIISEQRAIISVCSHNRRSGFVLTPLGKVLILSSVQLYLSALTHLSFSSHWPFLIHEPPLLLLLLLSFHPPALLLLLTLMLIWGVEMCEHI